MTKNQTHKKLLQHIFEASTQAILVLNNALVITKANSMAQTLFGFNKNAIENKCILTVIPEFIKRIKSHTDQNITGLWILKKDGSQSLVNLQLKYMTNTKGSHIILFLQDATNNLLYQWALKESQKELSHIESEGNLGNWYWFFETNERYWSDEFYRICGLPPGDARLNEKTALLFIHPDDREMVLKEVTQAIEKEIPYNLEKRIVQPDGTVRNIIARGTLDYNAKGDPISISGTIRDITLLKKEQQALLESNRKHQTLIDNLRGIVYSCQNNLEYTMNYINDGCQVITGYTRNEFLNGTIHFSDIIIAEDRVYVWNEIQKALSQKTHFDIKYRITCKQGTIKHVREIGCAVYSDTQISLEGFITDETEQKKTQDILEIRNRALEAAGSGIIIADALKPNLPIIYCNQSFTKITGYEKAEVIGKNWQFLQNSDRDQPQIKIMSIAIKEGKPCRVILRNYRKDGTQFWNDLTITPIKSTAGKLTHFVGIQNDITEQKQAEILKDYTNDILELITENIELSVIGNKIIEAIETQIPGSATIISSLNLKTNTFKNLSASSVIQPLLKELYKTKAPYLRALHPAFSAKEAIIIPNIIEHAKGIHYKDLMTASGFKSCWSYPVLSKEKKLLALFSIYHTDEKKISKKNKEIITDLIKLLKVAIEKNHISKTLKEKEEQLQAYTHSLEQKVEERRKEVVSTIEELVSTNLNLEDQILVAQAAEKSAGISKSLSSAIAKNFPNGFIIVFDANFEIILKEGEVIKELGLDKVIFEGMPIEDIVIFSTEQKTMLKENIIKTMKGEHLSFEIAYKKKYFSVNTTPLVDENDVIFSALFVYSNITQHKKMEHVAQKALKKEQELNELKSRFISMASHEFRTPLSAILTSAILIGKQNKSDKAVKRDKYVKQIKKNVKHLVAILNDFLSLSRLEEGKIIANRDLYDLVDFSRTVIEEISITSKTGQTIQLSSSRKLLTFTFDPKLMRHILRNLLSNAIKYSPENTTIHFNIDDGDQFVVLSVKDQGIGIPIEEQKNVFERFFRAKNAHNIEGTGLGLHIVNHYVELMDGSISFNSEQNKGTTFWLKLLKP